MQAVCRPDHPLSNLPGDRKPIQIGSPVLGGLLSDGYDSLGNLLFEKELRLIS
jgi:hypothetical protein